MGKLNLFMLSLRRFKTNIDHCDEHPEDCETIDGVQYKLVAEEEERIFTRVDSKTVTFEGLYNFNGGLVNSAEYSIRDTEYVHVEAHAELGGHDDHEDEEEGMKDMDQQPSPISQLN